jgi:hypothetical protein
MWDMSFMSDNKRIARIVGRPVIWTDRRWGLRIPVAPEDFAQTGY